MLQERDQITKRCIFYDSDFKKSRKHSFVTTQSNSFDSLGEADDRDGGPWSGGVYQSFDQFHGTDMQILPNCASEI